MNLVQGLLLATEAAPAGGSGTFIKGVAAFLGFIIFFVGATWLLTAMILGAKLGYFVTGACLFGVTTILSAIWFVTALGPKGPTGFFGTLGEVTAWNAVAVGPDLGAVKSKYGALNVADYPNGGWVEPSDKGRLADLKKGESTSGELANARPVMDALVGEAVSPIPGIRDQAKDRLTGEVTLKAGEYSIADVKMKAAKVAGKESIVAVGRAVPKAPLPADLAGAPEAELVRYVVKTGAQVKKGDVVAEAKTGGGTIQLKADKDGRVIAYGFRKGDKVKPGVSFATVDITGQPGAPAPVEVAAARVRGSVRVPSFIYLVVSLVLLALHLIGLNKIERADARVAQPQAA